MPEWYKTSQLKSGDKLVFQPIEKDGVEKFSLWDVKNKSFIRSGEQIKTAKGMQEVNKYISLSDDEKKRWGRNFKIERQVIIDKKLYNFDVPVTVDKALHQQMKFLEEEKNEDPMEYEYILKREGQGLNTTYFVMYGDKVGIPEIPEEDGDSDSPSHSFNNKKINTNALKGYEEEYILSNRQNEIINKIKASGLTDMSDIYRNLQKYGFGKEWSEAILKQEFGF